MTPVRRRRLLFVVGILAGVGIAGGLALRAFKDNVTLFFDPSQVVAGEVKVGQRFRLGGMVEKGSIQRTAGTLEVKFIVTDFKERVPVSYSGVLPDLFKEDSGVVTHGRLQPGGSFVADEVLAKHDEKYMPPEVKRSLKPGDSRADVGYVVK
jgi:cytochrome c-type biogenesis protein CcmE